MSLPVPKGASYRDENDKRLQEARNGIVQTNFVIDQASSWTSDTRLTPEIIVEAQRLAINQIYRCAGHFRDGEVRLQRVDHRPPPHTEVPDLVEALCGYVRDNWAKTPIHLAAYAVWRTNWIHPFFGGNGRTARAISYLILCARLEFVLPGSPTIPDLVVKSRGPYMLALQAADRAWAQGQLDLSAMEDLMSSLLADQLLTLHEQATGKP